jgi:hypothetical protein
MTRVVRGRGRTLRSVLVAGLILWGGLLISGCAEPELPRPGFPATLLPAEDSLRDEGLPTVPWLATRTEYWATGSPSFEIAEENGDLSARGWIAVTREEIRLKVTVSDESHVSPTPEAEMRDGDSLRIAIDALGDGFAAGGRGSAAQGSDDAVFTIALAERGPTVRRGSDGAPGGSSATRDYRCEIIRSDSVGTTTYEAAFPWNEMGAKPGVSPVFGLSIEVSDYDEGEESSRRIRWGDDTGSGTVQKLRVATPPGAYGALAIQDPVLWRKGDSARVAVVVSAGRWAQVTARLGDRERLIAVPPSGRQGLQRFVLHVAPPGGADRPARLSVELSASYGLTMDRVETRIEPAYAWVAPAMARLRELADQANEPLLQEHWRCVEDVCARCWEDAALAPRKTPHTGLATLTRMARVVEALRDPSDQWEDYLLGRRPLLRACASPEGGSPCLYAVYLPRSWEADRAYPVSVEIRASEGTDPLSALRETLLRASARRRIAIAKARRNGYVVIAWGDLTSLAPAVPWPGTWRSLEDFRAHFRATDDVTYTRDLAPPLQVEAEPEPATQPAAAPAEAQAEE